MKKIVGILFASITSLYADFEIRNYLEEPIDVRLVAEGGFWLDIKFTVDAAKKIKKKYKTALKHFKPGYKKKSSLARIIKRIEVTEKKSGRKGVIKPQSNYYDSIIVKPCRFINPAWCAAGEKRDIPYYMEDPDKLTVIGRGDVSACGKTRRCGRK